MEEKLIGPTSTEIRRWLVSVKHYAQSRKAVSIEDEIDPVGRCRHHGVQGFIGFYSTLPSSSLTRRYKELSEKEGILFYIYDEGRISKELYENARLRPTFKRYFPKSSHMALTKEIQGQIQFYSSLGLDIFMQDRNSIPGPKVNIDTGTGQTRFVDFEMELSFYATYIFSELRAGRFQIVEPVITFDPDVWSYLSGFLTKFPNCMPKIGDAILFAKRPFFNRTLLRIAGEVRQYNALESICATVLNDGYRIHQSIKKRQALVTPYFDVAQKAIKRLAKGQSDVLLKYKTMAEEKERWQQYQIFKRALEAS